MIALAWRNLWRKRWRSIVTLLAVALVVYLTLFNFGLMAAAKIACIAISPKRSGMCK
ncbi:MAG: hypothetical protein R2865_03355 [Deinococcales bacterium]